ncbi:hypothetical protein Bbelb_094080 [Branchiostoma belcheri]|nr:hypothetical protein Bbelb_094080 [Branchiostoma belcheri]
MARFAPGIKDRARGCGVEILGFRQILGPMAAEVRNRGLNPASRSSALAPGWGKCLQLSPLRSCPNTTEYHRARQPGSRPGRGLGLGIGERVARAAPIAYRVTRAAFWAYVRRSGNTGWCGSKHKKTQLDSGVS